MYTTAGMGIITQKPRYSGCPISHFLADDHPWHGLSGVGSSDSRPRTDYQVENGSSTVMAEDGGSLHTPRSMMSARNSMYSTSSIPTLTSDGMSSRSGSDLSSTQCNQQMYNLPSDSFGILNTHRPNAAHPVAVHTMASREGMYRCLFSFIGCTTFCTLDTWVSHVNTHLSDADPPESCLCTICGEEFESESGIPKETWGRFLNHVLNHGYPGAFNPDPVFVEFCRVNDMISDFTSQRLDQNITARASYQHHGRELDRERERRTPRRVVHTASIEFPEIAQVEYRSSWGEVTPVAQRAIERDIVVNRGSPRGHRGHRT